MTTEEWRAIPEHEHYEVSNLGRVRSVDRTIMKACGPCKLRGKILSQFPTTKYGYLRASLGSGHAAFVHRLVAGAFIGPADGRDVDHVDGDPSNNVVSNLRYLSHAENMAAIRERVHHCKRGHSLADAYWTRNGRRNCRTCRKIHDRERYQRRKAASGS